MSKYVIIGCGIAAVTAAENIRKYDQKGTITIIGDEPLPLYSRIRLPEYICGKISESDLIIKDKAYFRKKKIDLLLGTAAIEANQSKKEVKTDKQGIIKYDKLLIAAGSSSFVPPIPGADKENVFTLRNVDDANRIKNAENAKDVVIIGGGLLGLEAGYALLSMDKRVTVIDRSDRLLSRQLDFDGASKLKKIMEKMGYCFCTEGVTEKIEGDSRVLKVTVKEKGSLPADMVLISAGVRPNLNIAEKLGLDIGKGIKVDNRMHTSLPDIFAAGDVAEFEGNMYGIWPASVGQGAIAGANMAGYDTLYNGTIMSNILKVASIDLASAGNIDVEGRFEKKTINKDDIYKKVVIDDGTIIGCIMMGDKKDFNKVLKAITDKTPVSSLSFIDDIVR